MSCRAVECRGGDDLQRNDDRWVSDSAIGQRHHFPARQALTRGWWDARRRDYDLFVSQFVLDEAGAGDPEASQERLRLVDGLPLLDVGHPDVERIADLLIERHLLPSRARADAQHVAVATVFAVDDLMTWNCRHIANADRLPSVYSILRAEGYDPPLIVTPEEFRTMNKRIYDDPVVAEVHAIREALLERCGGDILTYRKQAGARQAASGRVVITSPLEKKSVEGAA